MRKIGILLFLIAFTACSSAPKPAECKGEFKPINKMIKDAVKVSSTVGLMRCNEGEMHGNKG